MPITGSPSPAVQAWARRVGAWSKRPFSATTLPKKFTASVSISASFKNRFENTFRVQRVRRRWLRRWRRGAKSFKRKHVERSYKARKARGSGQEFPKEGSSDGWGADGCACACFCARMEWDVDGRVYGCVGVEEGSTRATRIRFGLPPRRLSATREDPHSRDVATSSAVHEGLKPRSRRRPVNRPHAR